MKKAHWIAALSLFVAGAAYAESMQGTVIRVNKEAKTFTLTRSDTHEDVTVSVRDESALDRIKAGSPVRVKADGNGAVGWTATSVKVPAAG